MKPIKVTIYTANVKNTNRERTNAVRKVISVPQRVIYIVQGANDIAEKGILQ
jgi:hypothetical protein